MICTILVPLTAEVSGETLLDAALVLARRVNSHIRALFILPDPDAALAYLPDVILAAGVTREVIERETQEAAAKEKQRFIDWRTRNNLPETAGGRLDTCFATWAEQIGEIEAVVTRCGRLGDLIVVPRPAPGSIQAQRCFDAAVFGSGHPTLVIGERVPSDIIDHVMIAWNGSLEASRAVFGAMPLLHLAGRVSIFAAPQYDVEGVDPADLADYLLLARDSSAPGGEPQGRPRHRRGPGFRRFRTASNTDRDGRLHPQSAKAEFSRRCDEASPRARSGSTADEPLNF